jgi:integrase
LARIRQAFGHMQLSAVRPSHVRTWTSQLTAEGLSPSYVYALHSRLGQLFSDAMHDGLVAKSPCSRRTSPGAGKQLAYVATTEQVWTLHDVMPEHLRAAVLLGAFAGLRVAEVRPADLRRGLHARDRVASGAVPGRALKNETSRTPVPVPQAMALRLSAHVGAHPGETVLTDMQGLQIGPWVLDRAIRDARAKVPSLPPGFRYHDLRHCFASLLIASGADVKVVQARLRHASAKTTLDTYGHLWPDSDDSTRTAVAAVFAARDDDKEAAADA